MQKPQINTVPKTPLRFIGYILKNNTFSAIGTLVVVITAQALGLVAFYMISRLIDDFGAASTTAAQLESLTFWGTAFFAIYATERILWRVSGFWGMKTIIESVAFGYRKLYDYLTGHSQAYFANRFAGALSNKVSNAVDSAGRMADRLLWGFVPEIVSVISTIVLFWLVHWSIAAILIFMVIIILAFNIWFVQKRRPHVIAYAKAHSKVRGEGVDMITNSDAVRQYVRRSFELRRFYDVLDDRASKDKRQTFMGEWLMLANTAFSILLTGAVLFVVYQLLESGSATGGQLVLVLVLLTRIGYLFTFLGTMLNGFIRMYGEIEEGLGEIMRPHEVVDATNATDLELSNGKITWQSASFSFDSLAVFTDFNLTIEPGQRLGLVGHSGAGKTTFVSLLLRQHDLESGKILIDDQDISSVTQESLRQNITVVPQEPMLFHRSIKENILYGKPDASDEEVIEVAKKAQAHEFISRLPNGYDTLVGERGVKLSGGQKQRVAIARAMLKDAPILVLDEATSALDSESEVLIQKALENLMEGKTVIAVAHRLSTLRKMDRIVVLADGQVIEDGSHDELSTANGTYQKLWEHQAGGFIIE